MQDEVEVVKAELVRDGKADAVAGAGYEGPRGGAVGVAGDGGAAEVEVKEAEEFVEGVGCGCYADAEKGPEGCFQDHSFPFCSFC